ncbi:MAG: tail sheath stabilizer and completion protein [Methanobacterium sp.]
MDGKFYYHEIIRRTSAAFGTLFNNIYIRHQDGEGDDFSYIKVPIAYGPIQKFLARVEQKPDSRNRVALTLPRMSFEVGQLNYDSSRKSSSLQTFNALVGPNNTPRQLYMPVPYNLPLELTIATKYNDDMFQIIEQILPLFRPEFNLSVNLSSTIGEKRDVPLVLQGISPFQDDYEGNFDARRFITATLNFVAKIYFFGPVDTDDNGNIIKKVQVDYYSDTNPVNASRIRRYVVTPRATKDYNDDNTTTITEPITTKITKFEVSNGSSLTPNSYIQINNENMFIKSIDGNLITVLRGQDGTEIQEHQEGDVINIINFIDDELIVPGDDFDFNEETFDFGDGLIYSPKKGEDV